MEIKISLLEMECKGKKLFIYYQIKKVNYLLNIINVYNSVRFPTFCGKKDRIVLLFLVKSNNQVYYFLKLLLTTNSFEPGVCT